MLWKRSLIMYDLETKTLWSHILGEAMHGPLKGAKLEILDSSLVAWSSWSKSHPNTKVTSLSKSKRNLIEIFTKISISLFWEYLTKESRWLGLMIF